MTLDRSEESMLERRLERKLRRDLAYLGLEPSALAHMSLEAMVARRRRLLRDLIETAPKGQRWP